MIFSPFSISYWNLGFKIWRMSADAQTVMALRMSGMAGFWTLAPDETARMIVEKQEAFTKAFLHAGTRALQGKRVDQIVQAALAPVQRRTSSNSRRLGRSLTRQMF